jgi:hypothetical protein
MKEIRCVVIHENVIAITEYANLAAPRFIVIECDEPSFLHMTGIVFLLFQR